MNNKDEQSTRRDFLSRGTGFAAATAGLASAAGGRAASKALPKITGRVLGANDRINIAFIGNGMQFQTLIRVFQNRKKEKNDVQFAAVCDVWEPRLKYAPHPPGAQKTYPHPPPVLHPPP